MLTPEKVCALPQREKVISYDDAGVLIQRFKNEVPVFLAQGVFDVVHLGHAGYLQAARSLDSNNGIVIVGIENDQSVRQNKGDRRPINTEEERAGMLAEFTSPHLVFTYPDSPDYNNPEDYIDRYSYLRPTGIVVPIWDQHLHLKEQQAAQAGTSIATVVYKHFNSTTRMLREVGYE